MRELLSADGNGFEPGVHSHNQRRLLEQDHLFCPPPVRAARRILLVVAVCALGFYGYSLADQYVYQGYENWVFEQQIAGTADYSFREYVKQKAGLAASMPVRQSAPREPAGHQPALGLAPGELLGRVLIPRLHLSAMVREGVDSQTLTKAVGHVPSTAQPGQLGNFAIAAHRDTLFRALKDIQPGDEVAFETTAATYTYKVASTKIVKPSDVSVLRSGGESVLTMITCYPFYYLGSAPKRFIVQARLISEKPTV
jgi:sortase A